MTLLTLFFLVLPLISSIIADGVTVVKTPRGGYEGILRYFDGTRPPVHVFLGIPYAEPPVDQLRFKPPVPLSTSWSGNKMAKNFGDWCVQDDSYLSLLPMFSFLHHNFSEDCLTLNIYSPRVSGKYPVLFYMHGGSWVIGMSGLADGTALASYEYMVVVTINYRLGALGFLSTNDENAPGNLGLLDQLQALKWVKGNIGCFGGDPDRITIAGQDAGAWSTTIHMVSPMSKPTGNKSEDLFVSAITFSGSSLLPSTATSSSIDSAFAFANTLGCNFKDDTKALVDCMRNKTTTEIVKAQSDSIPSLGNSLPSMKWTATIDGASLLPKHPAELFRERRSSAIPYLSIINSFEGVLLSWLLNPDILETYSYVDFERDVATLMKTFYPSRNNWSKVKDLAENFYIVSTLNKTDSKYAPLLRRQFIKLLGSALIDGPVVQTARYHSVVAPTYLGVFDYKSSFTRWPAWVTGASHLEEQMYLWGYGIYTNPASQMMQYTEDDKRVTLQIMSYIGSFVRTGIPQAKWKQFTTKDEAYLRIANSSEFKQNAKCEKFNTYHANFWTNVVPLL